MADKRQIMITKEDHERLDRILTSEFAAIVSDKTYLQSLRGKLNLAQIVSPEDVPFNVVTMNSTVRLRQFPNNEIETYTLVYPEAADIAEGKLSVLAPVGTGILGYQVGDRVEWNAPNGVICFKIEELVNQPEQDGVLL